MRGTAALRLHVIGLRQRLRDVGARSCLFGGMGGKMSEPSSEALRTADGSGVLEAQTPYQHTVNGLLVPWRFQLLYDGAAGLALAAIGLPAIALIWVLVSIAADLLCRNCTQAGDGAPRRQTPAGG
jgi:hypothetical protein